MLRIFMEGLTQPPQISLSVSYSLALLLALSAAPLTLLTEKIVGVYLAVQFAWSLLLSIHAKRAIGSQSARRELEQQAKEAWLKWIDVLRFSVAELVCRHTMGFEAGAQVCMLYGGTGALRAIAKPFFYALLCLSTGPEWATKLTGYSLSSLLEFVDVRGKPELASGPAWARHGRTCGPGVKETSARVRVSSLAPLRTSAAAKNNNDRCTMLNEGPHFNRTARGCLLRYSE
ncbi:hypothetical protein LSCM1_02321 [Leishmania martiniquensis]|uniref:Uncharacterized protein n=1 Tax=Leishmania martiniquensis TaxID=1580590 RepID=A0A836H023_9TRYP|nr:hypothetical protein LSCM1_02321 [Leishmania martiniquensis]